MSLPALVWWICLGAAVLLVIFALAGPGVRCVREVRRLLRRIKSLGDLPLFGQIERAERDFERIGVATDGLPALVIRARAALAEIRATRLVPPALTDLILRTRAEITAFRRAAQR
ncbi:MAG: hypothetical protein ABR591_03050 [Candidatus Velthaea sp.]